MRECAPDPTLFCVRVIMRFLIPAILAVAVSGCTASSKLDVLDHFDEIQLCTGYRLGDRAIDYVPDTVTQTQVEPVYEAWPGWQADTSGCRSWNDLPGAARAYLRRIEELAGAPIRFVSVGPERSQMVVV